MKTAIFHLVCAVFVLCGSVAEASGPFVPPEDKMPPFRRDRLPMDPAGISWLAQSLRSLTQTGTSHTAQERRLLAQTCAIMRSLEPQNEQFREQILSLQEGEHSRTITDPEKIAGIRDQVWRHFVWLSATEAGRDGNILSAYLGDVISAFDPDHATAQVLRSKADPKRWDGWVAPLDQFEEKIEEQEPGEEPEEEEKETPERPEVVKPSIRLEKANLTTVLQTYDEDMRIWSPNPVNVTMEVSKDEYKEEWEEHQNGIKVHVSAEEQFDWAAHDMIASPVRDMLEKLFGELPRQGKIRIKANDDGYEYNANRSALTGAGLVLAHACLSGKAPTGTVIGEIGLDGDIILPEHFWRQFMALSEKGEGGRLVLPAQAADYMPALLTLGKAEFFLKYEVVVASSPQEYIDLSSSEPNEEHAAIFAKFEEIVAKAPNGQAGSYIANRFVRQRLQEIVDTAPYHISAKALALQGAGTHPRYLSKKVLAAEIWRSMDIIGEVAKVNFWEINTRQVSRMDEIQREISAKLDALERYADTRDRDLVRNAKVVTDIMKLLYRDLRAKDNEDGSRMEAVMRSRDKLVDSYQTLVQELAQVSEDPLADDEGKRKRFRLRKQEE